MAADRITLKVPPRLRTMLEAAAELHHRSLNAELRLCAEAHVLTVLLRRLARAESDEARAAIADGRDLDAFRRDVSEELDAVQGILHKIPSHAELQRAAAGSN